MAPDVPAPLEVGEWNVGAEEREGDAVGGSEVESFEDICKNLKRVMVRDGICVSNSFYVVFYPILALISNFIQIGRKTQKLKIFN